MRRHGSTFCSDASASPEAGANSVQITDLPLPWHQGMPVLKPAKLSGPSQMQVTARDPVVLVGVAAGAAASWPVEAAE